MIVLFTRFGKLWYDRSQLDPMWASIMVRGDISMYMYMISVYHREKPNHYNQLNTYEQKSALVHRQHHPRFIDYNVFDNTFMVLSHALRPLRRSVELCF